MGGGHDMYGSGGYGQNNGGVKGFMSNMLNGGKDHGYGGGHSGYDSHGYGGQGYPPPGAYPPPAHGHGGYPPAHGHGYAPAAYPAAPHGGHGHMGSYHTSHGGGHGHNYGGKHEGGMFGGGKHSSRKWK